MDALNRCNYDHIFKLVRADELTVACLYIFRVFFPLECVCIFFKHIYVVAVLNILNLTVLTPPPPKMEEGQVWIGVGPRFPLMPFRL